MKKAITNDELYKGLHDGKKFQATAEGGIYIRGLDAGTYIRLGVLPVNTDETRAEALRRLRNANPNARVLRRRGAGRGQARKIFAAYCAELDAAK